MDFLQQQGIDRAVILTGGERTGTAAARLVVAQYPDFFAWMCNFDPVDPDSVYDRMAAFREAGAIGVGELAINQWMDSPMLTAIFAAAEQLEMPVTIHMSPEPGYNYGVCDRAGLPLLEQTLQRFPRLKLLGHSQLFWLEISADCPKEGNDARNSFGKGPVIPGRVEELMRRYPNLYGDLSAGSGSSAILRDEAYGLRFLEEFQDRLFFATDTAHVNFRFPLGQYLDDCRAQGKLSETAYQKICRGNAQRVFGL